jgi:glycosyltransferase involved in cell wall biosynthesis
MLGMRDDVADLLPAFDVFVLSSLWEGLPRVLVEAMAARLPVVATDVDGVGEIVIDHRTGLLVPPARPDRMAEAIESILTDEALRQRLAEHSPERLTEFHVNEMVARLSVLYAGANRESLGVAP